MARLSRTLPLGIDLVTLWRDRCPSCRVPRPRPGNATGLSHQIGLGLSRFARRYSGSRCCFPFHPATEMFQFAEFPLAALCVQAAVTPHHGCRVSPFGHPRIEACSAAPRGLSQPTTSFFGSRRQGIHRWPFIAWENKDARARSAVLKGPGDARGKTSRWSDAGLKRPAHAEGAPCSLELGRSLKTEERTK